MSTQPSNLAFVKPWLSIDYQRYGKSSISGINFAWFSSSIKAECLRFFPPLHLKKPQSSVLEPSLGWILRDDDDDSLPRRLTCCLRSAVSRGFVTSFARDSPSFLPLPLAHAPHVDKALTRVTRDYWASCALFKGGSTLCPSDRAQSNRSMPHCVRIGTGRTFVCCPLLPVLLHRAWTASLER